MKNNIDIYILLCLFTIVFFSGCKGDDEQSLPVDSEITTYSVKCNVGLRSGGEYDSENEMMKTLLIFFVDSDNKIEKKVELTLPATKQQIAFEVQLIAGQKTVYGFSDLSNAAISSAGLNIAEGATMPDLTNATIAIANGFEIDITGGNYLPMSNKTIFTVIKAPGQSFSMDLIRMVCKVKLNFKNETGHTIAIKNIILGPLTTSSVYLMPRSDGQTAPQLPTGTTAGQYTYTFTSSPSFIDGGELNDYTFYINESQTADNEWFKLTLNTQRDGLSDEVRMSLTNLTYLNRNDYLPLNIILTDYKLELEVISYSPIGGYPASVTTAADGYHCSFPGGGPFIIIPKLLKYSDGSEITGSVWSFTYTDNATSIFDKNPVLKNGEIIGTLKSTSTGSALCTISVNVITSTSITRTISYKVFISQN
jgi:hypothetical protein